MTRILIAASAGALIAGLGAPAMAQEWSGPYIGVYGGVIEQDQDEGETLVFDRDFDGQYDDAVVTGAGANAFGTGFCDGQIRTASGVVGQAGTCDSDEYGVEGGARVGYDFQFGNFVVGAVGEISAVSAEDSVTGFSTTPAYYAFTRELEHMAGLRARVGYAAGDLLYYVTGGAAYAKVENSFATNNAANSFTVIENEDDADGYQLGAGLEWRVAPGLSITGEYMYSDLETGDYTIRVGNSGTTPAANPFILAPNTVGTDMTRSGDAIQLHAVRIGMNVRF